MGEKPTQVDESGATARASTLNERRATDGTAGPPQPPEAAINNSHSNIKNLREGAGEPTAPGGGGDPTPEPPETAINNSHSNIKNLREAAGEAGATGGSGGAAMRPGDPIPDIDITLKQNPGGG